MAASVANLAELRQEELDAMAWHPIESLQKQCCIDVEMLTGKQQHIQTGLPTTLCNEPTGCILCAGLTHLNKSMKDNYLDVENMKIILEGELNNPQSPLQSIEDHTKWEEFYIIATQYFANDKLTRKKFSHLGARGLPLTEVQAAAASHSLQSQPFW